MSENYEVGNSATTRRDDLGAAMAIASSGAHRAFIDSRADGVTDADGFFGYEKAHAARIREGLAECMVLLRKARTTCFRSRSRARSLRTATECAMA